MFSILGFLEGTSFCFSFKIFLFGFISCTLSFSYCYYWFIYYEKKIIGWLWIFQVRAHLLHPFDTQYTLYTRCLQQYITPLKSVGIVWCPAHRHGIAPMNLASVFHTDTWVLQQSCMLVGEHSQDLAQLIFPKSQSTLISELKLLPCSLSCVLSALPVPFSKALNLPTLPLVYLIKITF